MIGMQMLLTTWLKGHLKTYLVSKLKQGNLISPNERTIIDFVNLQLRRSCIIFPRKRKS